MTARQKEANEKTGGEVGQHRREGALTEGTKKGSGKSNTVRQQGECGLGRQWHKKRFGVQAANKGAGKGNKNSKEAVGTVEAALISGTWVEARTIWHTGVAGVLLSWATGIGILWIIWIAGKLGWRSVRRVRGKDGQTLQNKVRRVRRRAGRAARCIWKQVSGGMGLVDGRKGIALHLSKGTKGLEGAKGVREEARPDRTPSSNRPTRGTQPTKGLLAANWTETEEVDNACTRFQLSLEPATYRHNLVYSAYSRSGIDTPHAVAHQLAGEVCHALHGGRGTRSQQRGIRKIEIRSKGSVRKDTRIRNRHTYSSSELRFHHPAPNVRQTVLVRNARQARREEEGHSVKLRQTAVSRHVGQGSFCSPQGTMRIDSFSADGTRAAQGRSTGKAEGAVNQKTDKRRWKARERLILAIMLAWLTGSGDQEPRNERHVQGGGGLGALDFLKGVRVGEAKLPGPYSEGGATGSGCGGWSLMAHGRWERKGDGGSGRARPGGEASELKRFRGSDELQTEDRLSTAGASKEALEAREGRRATQDFVGAGGMEAEIAMEKNVEGGSKGEVLTQARVSGDPGGGNKGITDEMRKRIEANVRQAKERKAARDRGRTQKGGEVQHRHGAEQKWQDMNIEDQEQGRNRDAARARGNACMQPETGQGPLPERQRQGFDEEEGDPFANLDIPDQDGREMEMGWGYGGPQQELETDNFLFEEKGTEIWWAKHFQEGRDLSEDPGIQELEEYMAPIQAEAGQPVILPGEMLVKQWEKEQEQERRQRANRWKEVNEAYRTRQGAERGTKLVGEAVGTAKELRLAKLLSANLPTIPRVEEETNGFQSCQGSQPREVNEEIGPGQVPQAGTEGPGQKQTHKVKRRGRRSGKQRKNEGDDVREIWLHNSSGKPQFLAAVAHAATMGKGKVVAVINQEHHCDAAKWRDAQAQVGRKGWKAVGVHAVHTTRGGASAGVAIATPTNVNAGVGKKGEHDCAPQESAGRLMKLWIQDLLPSGVMLLSIYLWHSEGHTDRNVRLLCRALEEANIAKGPWIQAGDFQQDPDDLLKWAAPLLDKAGAKIVCTKEATNTPGEGTHSRLDFFIVKAELREAVEAVELIKEFAWEEEGEQEARALRASPHAAVVLKFRAQAMKRYSYAIRVPRRFQPFKPIGCPRAPVLPVRASAGPHGHEEDRPKEWIKEEWKQLVKAAETELCGLFDLISNGVAQSKWCGRGGEVELVKRYVLPRRAAAGLGHMRQTLYAAVWGLNRVKELKALVIKDTAQGGLARPQEQQWIGITRKMLSPKSLMVELLEFGPVGKLMEEMQRGRQSKEGLREILQEVEKLLEEHVEKASKEQEKRSRNAWRKWVLKQSETGSASGAAHAFVRRAQQEPDLVVRCLETKSAAPQDVVQADLADWRKVWEALPDLAAAPWRKVQWTSAEEERLEPITLDKFRRVARSFKAKTGVGLDEITPNQFAWLSDELIGAMLRLYGEIEKQAVWPQQLSTALIHLIPKDTGGRRPIGIIASFVRIWMKCRKEEVRQWKETEDCEYDWMAPGKGAEKAVWAQSVREEAVRQRKGHSAAVLLDLAKAFERVPLQEVWRRGLERGFPKRILALGLEVCAFGRRLKYRGAVSEEVFSLTALLAGMGLASDMLYLVLSEPVEEMITRFPSVGACLVADDIKLTVEGKDPEQVAKETVKATDFLIDRLEGRMGMKVSRDDGHLKGKTVALASTPLVARSLCGRMKKKGINLQRKVKNLGVDFAAGGVRKKGGKPTSAVRYKEAFRRHARALRLGRRLAPCINRAAIVTSVTYGVTSTGVTEEQLKKVRQMTARAYGPTGGRSITARLLLEGVDPLHVIVRKQIGFWIHAVWDELLPRNILQDAWMHAYKHVAMSERPHAAVAGGAGAFWSALIRAGWSSPSIETVKTADGTVLYYGRGNAPEGTEAADPRAIMKYLQYDIEQKQLADSELARDLADIAGRRGYARCKEDNIGQAIGEGGGRQAYGELESEVRQSDVWRRARFSYGDMGPVPWIEPARAAIRWAKRKGNYKSAGALRALVEGGWSTPRRKWAEGRAEVDTCECGKAAGTLYHWLTGCEKSREQREAKCAEGLLRQAVAGLWDPLFSRGVAARPKPVARVQAKYWWLDGNSSERRLAEGKIFIDGSFKGAQWRIARAAWAAVSLDEHGNWRWTYSGTLAEQHVSSYRAELTALYEVLRIAAGPVEIYCDNEQVVKGIKKGEKSCTAARTDGADIWRKIWPLLKIMGEEVKVEWILGHSTWLHVLERKLSPMQHAGNTMADKAAKEARAWAEGTAANKGFGAHATRAQRWYKWVIDFISTWPYEEYKKKKGEEETEEDARFEGTQGAGVNVKHEIWMQNGALTCRRCARVLGRGELQVPHKYETCKGTAAGRALALLTGNTNHLWAQYAIPAMDMIRKGASVIRAPKVPEIAIEWAKLEGFLETVEGRHSLRTCLGDDGWDTLVAGIRRVQDRDPTQTEGGMLDQRSPPQQNAAPEGTAQGRGDQRVPVAAAKRNEAQDGQAERRVRRRIWNKRPPTEEEERSGDLYANGEKEDRDIEEGLLPREGDGKPEEGGAGSTRRKRLVGKQKPPQGLRQATGAVRERDKRWNRGHHIHKTGQVVYCTKCGCFAIKRMGYGLASQCKPSATGASNAARLLRLRQGLHPLSAARI